MGVDIRFIITGCAGSGTGWAYRVMKALGSRCGHQSHFATSGVQSTHSLEGDSSWCAVPHIDGSIPTVFLRRDPLAIVRSIDQLRPFLNDDSDDPASAYVAAYRPDVAAAPDRFSRILRFVGTWGEDVESKQGVLPLRVEGANAATVARAHRHLTGRDIGRRQVRQTLEGLGSGFNTHGGDNSHLTWDNIRQHPDGHAVVVRAKKWGYR